ncbi:MAG: DUF1508 domain-containing protein [Clostridia bacterium]|nr:DUF1508 domain-containing protein [Clostridia bacterium]
MFIKSLIEYLKNHPTLAYVLICSLALVLVTVVVIIALACSRSKKAKAAALLQAQETEKASVEKAEADRVRKAAEQAKKEAEENALAEKLAAGKAAKEAEEKALAEKLAAEKAKKEADEKAIAEKIAAADVKKESEKKSLKKESNPKSPKKNEYTPANKGEQGMLLDELKDMVEESNELDDEAIDAVAKYSGKWIICRVVTDEKNEEEMYFFELHASNGEKLLSSEEYTSYNGALRGIETHKNNILRDNFKITLSKKGDYIFKLLSGKNMLLCMGENYPTKTRCENAIESAKRFAKTAVIDENIQDHVVKLPVEDDEVIPLPDGYNGKWVIDSKEGEDGEKVFYFELFANNGEKLLSSEEYTTYIGAVNGITTHKNNIDKGNFRITLTKRGDYIYKLLNGNGQLLCLGEHYKTKRRCQNAVESVKRFAKYSPVLTDPAHKK